MNVTPLPASRMDRGRDTPFDPTADLRSRLREGEHIESPIRMVDDVWDFTGAPTMGDKARKINFGRLPARDRTWMKELVLLKGSAMTALEFAPDNAAVQRYTTLETGNWKSAKGYVDALARWLKAAAEIPDDHEDYWDESMRRYDRSIPKSPGRRAYGPPSNARKLTVVSYAQHVHDLLIGLGRPSPFPGRPWGTRTAEAVSGARRPGRGDYDNKQRPHEDVFPWAGICLRFIDLAADDILKRLRWYRDNGVTVRNQRKIDTYAEIHSEEPRPAFVTDDHSLAPHNNALYWWSNRLVWASWYVLVALTALRQEEMSLLSPDCIEQDDLGRYWLSGLMSKGFDAGNEKPETWRVNANVVRAVQVVNDLREALGLEPQTSTRVPGRPMLFHNTLTDPNRTSENASPTLYSPLLKSRQDRHFGALARELHGNGLIPDPSNLGYHTHGVIRITCLEVHANGPLGDAVALSVGKWRAFKTPGGYIGHTTKVTAPAPTHAAEMAGRELLPLLNVAAASPEELTGRSAAKLKQQIAAAPQLVAPTVTEKAMLKAARRGYKTITVGPLCACIGPEGGKCGDGETANHQLCSLECRNQIFTPYQRAHLELRRRYALLALGPLAPFAARVTENEEYVLAGEQDMTHDELIDVLMDEWQTNDRELADLFYPLLQRDDTYAA